MTIFSRLAEKTDGLDKEINTNIKKLCDLLNYDVVCVINFNHGYQIATSTEILLKKASDYMSASKKWIKILDNFPNHILNLMIGNKKTLFYSSNDNTFKDYSPLIENVKSEIYIPILSSIRNTKTKDLIGCIYISTFDTDKVININKLTEPKITNIIYILNKLCEISYLYCQKNEFTFNLINMMSEITLQTNPLMTLHPYFVAQLSKMIAQSIHLSEHMTEQIYLASLLHDIGKIYIDKHILTKKTTLTNKEYTTLKEHSIYGSNMIKSITHLDKISLFVKHHHERYDGTGYPDGLIGTQIPLESRIIGIADAIDAMLSQRIYKSAQSVDFVIKELIQNSGKQFDPELVDIAINILSSSKEDTLTMSTNTLMWSTLIISTIKETYSIEGTLMKYNFGHIFKSNKLSLLPPINLNQVVDAKLSIPKSYSHSFQYKVTLDYFQENQIYISDSKYMFPQNTYAIL